MASVNFKRRNTVSDLDNIPIEDGNFIVTKDGHTFVDFDDDRIGIGGTPDLEMSDSSENSVQNKVVKSYIDNLINTLKNNLAGKVLWTNPNPNSAISEMQEITLLSDDYDVLEVFYIQVTNGNLCYTSKFLKGYSTRMRIHTSDGTNVYRGLTYLNDTLYRIDLPYSDTTIANVNSLAIPIYIMGYKTDLFS